jgi:hypothetical protein
VRHVTIEGRLFVNEQQKRAAFDRALETLQTAKAKVEAIMCVGLSKRTPPLIMDRLSEAQADFEKAKREFVEVCDKIENAVTRRRVA